jgi:hypothetical protein
MLGPHATTERGPRAVPRRGSDVPPRLAGEVRYGARSAWAAAVPLVAALNAPRLHGSSPVRRLRRPTARPTCRAGSPGEQEAAGTLARPGSPPRSTALLASPYSPQRGTALGPVRRAWCLSTKTSVVLAKPWSGVRRQRHCAAPRNAGFVAARAQRALRSSDSSRLFERSERSERSEFRDGPRDRVPQGSRPAGPAVAHERRRIPGRGFASLDLTNISRDHEQ